MLKVAGALMIVGGAALGLYVGVWLCFIGGIVDVITEIRAEQLNALNVAIGIAKTMFAGLFGWLSAFAMIVPGMVLLDK